MVDDSAKFRIAYLVSGMLDEEDVDDFSELSERYHYVFTFMALSHVQRNILSKMERYENILSSNDIEDKMSKVYIYYQSMFEDVILFYILYQDLVDYYSVRLLHDELIDETYSDSNKSYNLFEGLNQREREQFLKRTGILDHEYTDEMKEVRMLRNNLVHRPTERMSSNTVEGLIDNVDAAADVLEVLHTRVEDIPYWPDSVESFMDFPIEESD